MVRGLGHMGKRLLRYKAGVMMLLLEVMNTYDLLTVGHDDGMGGWIN